MNIRIEDFIPHRDRIKLLDSVVETGENTAAAESTVTDRWPLVKHDSVHPLVLIELVAQTSGIIGGLENHQKGNPATKGWIVGIKKAQFYVDAIPLGTRIITKVLNRFVGYGNFIEAEGTAAIGSEIIGEIVLQVVDETL